MMKILVTGRGTSGSWLIRGQQLGNAIGAHVQANAMKLEGFDLAIIVKRAPEDLLRCIKRNKVPIVWDVVDAWPQPYGNTWGKTESLQWMSAVLDQLKPVALVAATRCMATDCEVFHLPMLALPHHARPNQPVNPIRESITTVGYEGGPQYLGTWRSAIENACRYRGWTFVVNPPALADLDIVVAVREPRGYAARNWKSNVKLANAQATGTPCVLNPESGYLETGSGAETWAETPEQIGWAFDDLRQHAERQRRSAALREREPKLETIAEQYSTWLNQLNF